jgi:hypothetical protein
MTKQIKNPLIVVKVQNKKKQIPLKMILKKCKINLRRKTLFEESNLSNPNQDVTKRDKIRNKKTKLLVNQVIT